MPWAGLQRVIVVLSDHIHFLFPCLRAAKVQGSLCMCVDSSEPSLVADAISARIHALAHFMLQNTASPRISGFHVETLDAIIGPDRFVKGTIFVQYKLYLSDPSNEI